MPDNTAMKGRWIIIIIPYIYAYVIMPYTLHKQILEQLYSNHMGTENM